MTGADKSMDSRDLHAYLQEKGTSLNHCSGAAYDAST